MEQEILQQTPDWATAPEWAKWFAIDSDGEGYRHEEKPIRNDSQWHFGKKSEFIGNFDPTNWKNSLQQRPTQHPESDVFSSEPDAVVGYKPPLYPLFEYLDKELGVTALDTQMWDIVEIVRKIDMQ
jgi:hypothetical protein